MYNVCKIQLGGGIHGVLRSCSGQGALEVEPLGFAGAGALDECGAEGAPRAATPSKTQCTFAMYSELRSAKDRRFYNIF